MKYPFEIYYGEHRLGCYKTKALALLAQTRIERRKRKNKIRGLIQIINKRETPDPLAWTKISNPRS